MPKKVKAILGDSPKKKKLLSLTFIFESYVSFRLGNKHLVIFSCNKLRWLLDKIIY